MKLSNESLLSLLKYMSTPGTEYPEGVSLSQSKNFAKAYNGDLSAPKYMIDFVDFAKSKKFDVEKVREALTNLQDSKPLTAGTITPKEPEKATAKKFVFTSAQNNTDVHQKFFSALKHYCLLNNAELHIGKYTYNKNGFQNSQTDDDGIYYSKELANYFSTERLDICQGLTWCGDLNILPTAKNPISGFETLTGVNSSIIPHARIALESLPTPKTEQCKMIYATGTLTLHNYIMKKAGQIAQNFHCYGALVVEIDQNGIWHARQIQTDETGIFQDLNTVYYPNGETREENILCINWGDIHAEKSDYSVLSECQNMLNYFMPENQIFHDTFDMTARNHHNRKSGHFLAKMAYDGLDCVYDDISKAHNVLSDFYRPYAQGYVVESNHDLALEAWLDSNDYNFKTDTKNALTYLELQTAIYKSLSVGEKLNVLEYALTEYGNTDLPNTTFLNVDDSLVIGGIECGYHGHLGANGSRGNPTQFIKLNRPMNTGHTHAASIRGKVYTAGVTGSLDMGYNKGPGNWSHSHIITYKNGFRAIITFKPFNSSWVWSANHD